MTVLSACQSAFVRLVSRRPQAVFSSQDAMELEVAELANDVATDIMKSHDWQRLTRVHTLSGDGAQASFPLPEDYDRFAVAQGVVDPNNWFWGFSQALSMDDWITITSSGFGAITPGWWILLGGELQFSPTPSASQQATFPYISRNFATSAGGSSLPVFQSDADGFVLDERLLTLGIVWRWKAQKGLEYAEDLATYEKAFSEAAARDRGSQAIRKGGWGARPGTRIAWPWPLG